MVRRKPAGHKFDKVQYRVINWAEYNESLRQRGDLRIWVSEEAQSVWSAPRRTSRDGQRRYSDLAIETGTVKLSRIRPFCGRILLDQRLRTNDLAVAASGENAAKLLNLTVPHEQPSGGHDRTAGT